MSGATGNGCLGAGLLSGVGAFVLAITIIGGAIGGEDDKGLGLSGALAEGQVPEEYRQWVTQAGQQCEGVTAPLIAAQIEAESNWRPNAQSRDANGNVIAQGLSQFIPGTWRTWGVDADGDGTADPFTPADAIMTQARYDCWLLKKVKTYNISGDQTQLMLAGYNAGPDAVRRFGGIPPYPETQNYVSKILKLMVKYSQSGGSADINGTFGERVAAYAQTQLGVPYAWGGGSIQGPSKGFAQGAGTVGWDCSSLVQYAVYQASKGQITLPRTSQMQVTQGTAVSRADLRVGDLVGWSLNGGGFDHIGIYLGNGQFIHAPRTGDVVKVSSLDDAYYTSRPMKARRIG